MRRWNYSGERLKLNDLTINDSEQELNQNKQCLSISNCSIIE
jgi:hypothetical protein